MRRGRCQVVYSGPSYPEAHGTLCVLPRGHDEGEPHRGQKHRGAHNFRPIEWFTPEQKARRAAMKQPAAQPPLKEVP